MAKDKQPLFNYTIIALLVLNTIMLGLLVSKFACPKGGQSICPFTKAHPDAMTQPKTNW